MSYYGLTEVVAMDCEMVGVGAYGTRSILARVSIVNEFGHCVYDKYVKPTEVVTDYRTSISGIRPYDLFRAQDFRIVQKEVSNMIRGRILVGHSIHHDLEVLFLSHPDACIRDTAIYFRPWFGGRSPALRTLCEMQLGIKLQTGEHDSVEDARATMRLYKKHREEWESKVKSQENFWLWQALHSRVYAYH